MQELGCGVRHPTSQPDQRGRATKEVAPWPQLPDRLLLHYPRASPVGTTASQRARGEKKIFNKGGGKRKKKDAHALTVVSRTWVICTLVWSLFLLFAQFSTLHYGEREGVVKPKVALKPYRLAFFFFF